MQCLYLVFVVQAEDNERREKNLEEAKKIIIEKDSSLPEPESVSHSHVVSQMKPAVMHSLGAHSHMNFTCNDFLVALYISLLFSMSNHYIRTPTDGFYDTGPHSDSVY